MTVLPRIPEQDLPTDDRDHGGLRSERGPPPAGGHGRALGGHGPVRHHPGAPDVRQCRRRADRGHLRVPPPRPGRGGRVQRRAGRPADRRAAQGAPGGARRLRRRDRRRPASRHRRGGPPRRVHRPGGERAAWRARRGRADARRPVALRRRRGHRAFPAGGGAPLHPRDATRRGAGRRRRRLRHRPGARRLPHLPAHAAARSPQSRAPRADGDDRSRRVGVVGFAVEPPCRPHRPRRRRRGPGRAAPGRAPRPGLRPALHSGRRRADHVGGHRP